MTPRVLVVSGSRRDLTLAERKLVVTTVQDYLSWFDIDERNLRVGCANGVDKTVRRAFKFHSEYKADWKGLGGRAGPERNERMMNDLSGRDVFLGFPDNQKHSGTLDATHQAMVRGMLIRVYPLSRAEEV
jgi:hypothetical protein